MEYKRRFWFTLFIQSNIRRVYSERNNDVTILRKSDSVGKNDWLFGCGLTAHSAIFQLYSDGTVVQFSKF